MLSEDSEFGARNLQIENKEFEDEAGIEPWKGETTGQNGLRTVQQSITKQRNNCTFITP